MHNREITLNDHPWTTYNDYKDVLAQFLKLSPCRPIIFNFRGSLNKTFIIIIPAYPKSVF